MQSFPIETHHNKQITKTRSGMTSTNIGRTAAAAVVSVGIFGLVYSHKKGDEEERCASPKVDHPRWSQARERRIGETGSRETLMFNGYAEQVASLYAGMNLEEDF